VVYSISANLGVFLRKYTVEDFLGHRDTCGANKEIAVITLEPEGKASFGYSCMQTRLMDHTIENDLLASFLTQND